MESTQHRIELLKALQIDIYKPEFRSLVCKAFNQLYDEASQQYEDQLRAGEPLKIHLFKLKLMVSIIKDKDIAKAMHWYAKWDEATNDQFEEMCSNPEKYSVQTCNKNTGKIDGLKNSIMLDQIGKVYAEEKNLFRFLITLI
jgi:hypothetical protein